MTPATWSSSAPIRLTYLEEQPCLTAGARPGATLGQRYELELPLGAGTRGALWQGRQRAEGTPLTLQLLDPAIAEDPALLEAFLEEARNAAAIDHPHVVRVLDYGIDTELGPSVPYLVLERLSGETLAARLAAQRRLAPAELARIFREAARGLAALHEGRVLHRYLDPAHIFLDDTAGSTQLLCPIEAGFRDNLRLVRHLSHQFSGRSIGTGPLATGPLATGPLAIGPLGQGRRPQPRSLHSSEASQLDLAEYQSPEQLLGHDPVDERSDFWSLAVIAFEALTGMPAFSGASLGDRLVRICNGEPNAPPENLVLPAGFVDWFQRGVSKQPEERFGSAREMADTLTRILELRVPEP
jgi:eukaryotic-like serine/threonine-protein kinase